MLMSATMNADVERLQKLVLHNPVTLNLLAAGNSEKAAPGPGSAAEIEHFSIASDRSAALTLSIFWYVSTPAPLTWDLEAGDERGESILEIQMCCMVSVQQT